METFTVLTVGKSTLYYDSSQTLSITLLNTNIDVFNIGL